MKGFELKAYFTGFSPKADGSASVRFTTQELTPDDYKNLASFIHRYGLLVFKED